MLIFKHEGGLRASIISRVESVKSFVEEKEKGSGLPARRWLKAGRCMVLLLLLVAFAAAQ
jgi:hypothetical protein